MVQDEALLQLQRRVWRARLPLEIRIAPSECRIYDRADPYLISCPRLSYLPLLLPRLHTFFSPVLIADPDSASSDTGYFTFESVPLKWHLPLGLLYDIYVLSTADIGVDNSIKPSTPFQLTLHFNNSETEGQNNVINSTPMVLHDSFINSVKEADFLRSGTAKPIMSLSAADSQALWSSTQENDLSTYAKIHASLLPSPGQMRNIPFRIYLPSSAGDEPTKGQIRIIQSQISPFTNNSQSTTTTQQLRTPAMATPQTLGSALHTLIPTLFPSRRTPILARPILHGAQVPMNTVLEDLVRWCCYADGWISIVIVVNG